MKRKFMDISYTLDYKYSNNVIISGEGAGDTRNRGGIVKLIICLSSDYCFLPTVLILLSYSFIMMSLSKSKHVPLHAEHCF